MVKQNSNTREKRLADLKIQAQKLRAQLAEMNKAPRPNEPIYIQVEKTQAHFSKVRNPNGPDDFGLGKYLLMVEVTAGMAPLYVPTSIASGRKSTGFIYHIEGTAGATAIASITCRGEGIATVTSGSISYSKIPAGKTAMFKILAEVTGALGKTYKVVVSRINYKLNPNDLRYKKFLTEASTEVLKFR